MVPPGESDITTVSTGDAANSRRCWSVTPQQGGKSDIPSAKRKEVRKERELEGRRRSSETRRLTFDSTHRKYSVESASAWIPSSPCHPSVFVYTTSVTEQCAKERGGGFLPPPSCIPQNQHQGPTVHLPYQKT